MGIGDIMYNLKTIVIAIVILIAMPTQYAWSTPEIPVQDMVTMVDLGSKSCIPCKLMEPILEELQTEYNGKAAILFVDVVKDQESAKKFGIRVIPTQIFFDTTGKEVWRHAGFLEKEVITEKINSLLQ